MSLTDGRAIADFLTDTLAKKDIVMRSDGSSVRSFCYIGDFVKGLLTVLLLGKVGEAYNITNDRSRMSIKELAIMIAHFNHMKVVHKKRDSKDSYLISRVKDNNPNVHKLRTLGWSPNISLKQGFKRTYQSFLQK